MKFHILIQFWQRSVFKRLTDLAKWNGPQTCANVKQNITQSVITHRHTHAHQLVRQENLNNFWAQKWCAVVDLGNILFGHSFYRMQINNMVTTWSSSSFIFMAITNVSVALSMWTLAWPHIINKFVLHEKNTVKNYKHINKQHQVQRWWWR